MRNLATVVWEHKYWDRPRFAQFFGLGKFSKITIYIYTDINVLIMVDIRETLYKPRHLFKIAKYLVMYMRSFSILTE